MHEVAIANSILDSIQLELRERPDCRATKAGIRIGELSGVDSESLRFCFECCVRSMALDPLELDLEWCPGSDALHLSYIDIEGVEQGATAL